MDERVLCEIQHCGVVWRHVTQNVMPHNEVGCIFVCIFVCVQLCMSLCNYVCLYVCLFVCLYVCLYVYLYICLYVSMYVSMYLWMSLCVNIMECLAMNRTVNTTKTCMYRCMYDSHMIYVYEMQRNIIACCAFMRLWISVSLACVCKDVCHTCVHMHLC